MDTVLKTVLLYLCIKVVVYISLRIVLNGDNANLELFFNHHDNISSVKYLIDLKNILKFDNFIKILRLFICNQIFLDIIPKDCKIMFVEQMCGSYNVKTR